LLLLIHPQSEKNDVCRESNYSKTWILFAIQTDCHS
jgi:hypothetical protein